MTTTEQALEDGYYHLQTQLAAAIAERDATHIALDKAMRLIAVQQQDITALQAANAYLITTSRTLVNDNTKLMADNTTLMARLEARDAARFTD